MTETGKGNIIIYQPENNLPALEVRLEEETVWLTQKQISQLFNTERSVITKHIRNIFKTGELDKNSVCAKLHILPPMVRLIRLSSTIWI